MKPLSEAVRKALFDCYTAAHLPVPRHLWPAAGDTWRRYESDKERIPPCPPEVYEERIAEIAP